MRDLSRTRQPSCQYRGRSEQKSDYYKSREKTGNLLPVPWIEPEDVAEAVLYLASDRARFVTGSQFVIDAGLLTR